MIVIPFFHQSFCFKTTREPEVSACKEYLPDAHPSMLKSSSKPPILQINEIQYIDDLEQLVWVVQQLVDAKKKKKETDWNMAENHGNRLLSKRFMEAQ